jgi:tetratricopeptide (TPR) repeat protein
MTVKLKPTVLCIVGLVLMGANADAQIREAPNRNIIHIRGEVRLPGHARAPQGVLVRLQSQAIGPLLQTQTDSQGKFEFTGINQGRYTVSARQPGYLEAVQSVDLTVTPTSYVVLELAALPSGRETGVPQEGPHAAIPADVPESAREEFLKGQELASKDPGDSIRHLRKAVEVYPSFPEAYLLLGTVYMDSKKWKEAEEALTKAIQLKPESEQAQIALGISLNQQAKFAEAERALTRAQAISPASPQVQYELARAYWGLGRWQEAEPLALQAATAQPELAAVHVLLGNIMLRKRDAPGALRHFREYLRLEPQGPLAPATREMVAKIEKALAGN